MQRRQPKELFLGRIQPLDEALDFLLEGDVLTLKVVNESDEFLFGQVLRIAESGQNNFLCDRGVASRYNTMAGSIKQNLLRTLN